MTTLPHNDHIMKEVDRQYQMMTEPSNIPGSSAFSVVTPKVYNQPSTPSSTAHKTPNVSAAQPASNNQTPSTPRAPFTLPGLGIERHSPHPSLNYPKDLLSYMFLPYNKGIVLPPEYPFGIPLTNLSDMRPQVSTPTQYSNQSNAQPVIQNIAQPGIQPSMQQHVQAHTQALVQPQIQSHVQNHVHPQPQHQHQVQPPMLNQASIPRDAPSMQHIRLAIEDRDSGNESSSMSPPSSFTSSRSPSHSSRSNSFSMSSLLRSSENHPPPQVQTPVPSHQQPQSHLHPTMGTPRTPNTPSTPSTSNHVPRGLAHPPPAPFMLMPHAQMMNMSLPYNQQYMQMQLEQLRAKMVNDEMSLAGREVCDVCGDNASGFHYGVMSCEGCKGFFRRSVQKSMNYQCHRDGSCKVDRISRNRCQACRFQKCLSKGMTKESVRNDRIRKRKTSDDERDKELDSTRELLQIANDVVRAYRAAFPENCRIANESDAQSRCLEFMSNIPLFQTVRDQFPQLVQNAYLGITHLRVAHKENICENISVNMKLISRLQQGLKNVTEEELAIICAIHCANPVQSPQESTGVNQTTPSHDGASNPLWEKLVECLRAHRSSNNSSDKNQLFSLLQLLYQLATLSA